VLKGLDRNGEPQQVEGSGLLARAFQHEMDHLDGTLFVDRLRGLKRDIIVRKIRKLTRARQMVTTAGLRVVFFGTPDFAVPSLDALLASRHQVVAVVTQPDRPRGRGHKTTIGPVKARAEAAGVPILQPERLKDQLFLDALTAPGADLGVVARYGKILTDAVLATPRLGMINVHASLLPRHRGAAPVHRAIIAGDTETGVTIMRVVKALDAGPMLATVSRAIGPNDTSDEVERDLASKGAALLIVTIDALTEGRAPEIPQIDCRRDLCPPPHERRWPRRLESSGRSDSQPDPGLHPWPHAFTFARGQRLILHRAVPGTATSRASRPPRSSEAAGDRIVVGTGKGSLNLLVVQVEGKRPMAAREFLAGHPLTAGERFTAAL
jgi:methionyl-tRNA formyltransferase